MNDVSTVRAFSDPRLAAAQGLTVERLSIGYGTRTVIDDVSLAPAVPGSLVALVGANAAGKSTLLRALAGQLKPLSGRMRLDGRDLSTFTASERNRRIAYLPQTLPAGSSLYAWEAVMAACRATRPELNKQNAEAKVEAVFTRLGLQQLALRRLGELSGGQRQMVGLAQLVVRQAQLLLLDEPTSALDPRWQLEVLEIVREQIREQAAVALVAIHDLNLALRFCDRVLVLSQGKLLADGEPHVVMTPDVLRDAYGISGRVERCSQGGTLVLADKALSREPFNQ